MPPLNNPRHENFAHEVAAGTTYLAAYLASGFRETGSARSHASRLRARPDVQARIREIQEGGLDGSVSVEWVRTRLAPFLVIDPSQMYEKDPGEPGKLRLKPLNKIPKNLRLAITRLKLDKESGRPVEIHLADKLAAGMALIRSLTPDVAVQANINLDLAERFQTAVERANASRPVEVGPPANSLPQAPLPVQAGDRPEEV